MHKILLMGRRNKVYIIAEIGINHNGSVDICRRLINASVAAGCDAVKSQFFKARNLYPQTAGKLVWRDSKKVYSYDIYKNCEKFEFPDSWINNIIRYCKERNIDFFWSVFDIAGLRFLVSKGIRQIKIPSYAVTNIPLISACAKYKLPIIMSTGGATLGEVEEAVAAVNKYHNNLSLLHCSIKYPAELKKCNLGVIETLRYAFPHNRIGFSDHTKEVSCAAVQAVYLGAKIIEKHITLDKNMGGPDHFFALDPKELRKFVEDIRSAEKRWVSGKFVIDRSLYGDSAKITRPDEKYLRNFAFMGIFARKKIRKGQIISISDISLLRPGKKRRGLAPKYTDLFRKYKITAKRKIFPENPITWDAIL